MINNINNSPSDLIKTSYKSDKTDHPNPNNPVGPAESKKDSEDQVTLGSAKDPVVTYNKPLDATQQVSVKYQVIQQLVSSLTLNQGSTDAIARSNQSINDFVTQLFGKIGLSTNIDIGDGKTADLKSMTPEEAQKLIADDGYWGVEQTSNRIADFAIAQIGNDPSRKDQVIDAIMKGFNSAKEAFGGQLPDISQKTIDAVMSKLDKLEF